MLIHVKKYGRNDYSLQCGLTSSSLFYPLVNGNIQQTDKTA
ncbi:hypothetical protein [Aeribacillus composti]|nr:hypothetical protein [Aeribacillus composti]